MVSGGGGVLSTTVNKIIILLIHHSMETNYSCIDLQYFYIKSYSFMKSHRQTKSNEKVKCMPLLSPVDPNVSDISSSSHEDFDDSDVDPSYNPIGKNVNKPEFSAFLN